METKPKLISIISFLTATSIAHANLLANGNFENQPNYGINGDGGYTYMQGTQIPGWTIESGHAATVHNTNTYPTISGTYSVNTDGEGLNGHNIDMWQSFSTVAGADYTLEYDWLGWSQNIPTLDIRVERMSDSSTVIDDQHDWDNLGVHHMSLMFGGDGSAYRVRIFNNPESGFNDNTFIVDNFSLTSSVPEPASLAVLGLGAFGLMRRRK